jgi:hypothetical protein
MSGASTDATTSSPASARSAMRPSIVTTEDDRETSSILGLFARRTQIPEGWCGVQARSMPNKAVTRGV